ncbi:MAG TPA: MarR family transcriptional regulator [Candidatus Aquilonibacter sp.]|nr:MarR family transcriptional regulator [Candidatus Aquilonibacter sp.]
MPNYPSRKEKIKRAFRACTDLLDTADWIKSELRGPLLSFDLVMGEFRLLEMLYSEGALFVTDVARRRGMHRQGVDVIIARLERRGWARRVVVKLPPVDFERAHLAAAMKDKPREGLKRQAVALTKSGKKFIGTVLPNHSKLVKALMRAITSTEQDSLSRICRKLRAGDILKFVHELRMEDDD